MVRALAAMVMMVALAWPSLSWAADVAPWGQGKSRGQDLELQLLTFSPGDDIPSWFGHTALAVVDKRLRVKRVYNFGMFNFDDTMVAKFAMGRLEFWVGEAHYDRTLRLYARRDRDVRIQTLNFSSDKRVEIAAHLAWIVKPENRKYLYDHYFDNCATRIRDLIDKGTDGAFKKAMQATPARISLRDHTARHGWPSLLVTFGMMFGLNGSVDADASRWEEMFLPVELEMAIDGFRFTDASGQERDLVSARKTFYRAKDREPTPKEAPTRWPILLLQGLILGGIGLALARRQGKTGTSRAFGLYTALVIGGILGLFGFLLTMLQVTDHVVAHGNWNLLMVHPLSMLIGLLGLGVALRKPAAFKALKILLLLHAAGVVLVALLHVLPVVDQDMSMSLAFFGPIIVLMTIGVWRFAQAPTPR